MICTLFAAMGLLLAQADPGNSEPSRPSTTDGVGAAHKQVENALASELPRAIRAPNAACKNTETAVRFVRPETERDAGLEFTPATTERLARTIVRNAEIAYDANRYARLSPRAAGIVAAVPVDLGAKVSKGDVLAVVDSVELGEAKAGNLQAVEMLKLAERNFEREKTLVSKGVGTEREMQEAEAKLAEGRIAVARTRQRLRILGLTPKEIETVEGSADTSSLLELTAPFDGILVERSGVVGETAASGSPLLTVSDTTSMWAMIDLQTSDLAAAAVGQGVSVTVEGLEGETFGGRLTWISTQLDPKSRTVKARAELENRDGLLRASMFARAMITTRAGEPATMVPKAAVQWDGCCNLVFVRRRAEGMPDQTVEYQPRKVRLGYGIEDRYEALAGVQPGEMVVTKGSFLLKTEIMKDSIGAGCCDAVEDLAK